MKVYHVAVQFSLPQAGVLTVAAENEDHVKEKVTKLLSEHDNVVINDVTNLDDMEPVVAHMEKVRADAEAEKLVVNTTPKVVANSNDDETTETN